MSLNVTCTETGFLILKFSVFICTVCTVPEDLCVQARCSVMCQSDQRLRSILAGRADPVFGLETTFQPALVSGEVGFLFRLRWLGGKSRSKRRFEVLKSPPENSSFTCYN